MKEKNNVSHIIVKSTFPDRQSAESMAKRLLEKRLVACVQFSEIDSFYHWQGEIANDREIKFTAKTRSENIAAIGVEIDNFHPYDIPQFVVVPIINASGDYLRWIDAETQIPTAKE